MTATAPPRSALITAALGAPFDGLPEAVREAGQAGPRLSSAVTERVARAAKAATDLVPFLDPLPVPRVIRGREGT
ncbi:hypothetical protein [Streptomyces sp. NPDC058542]|uniref:hypothetical protein n=1 Tax=Streptomyces sp. NPDC058542 TaxID=3346543 RepID=UPI003660EAC5